MKINSKKKGFTLIELLIVISIVVALSTLAVSGYSSYRKATLLDLSADNLASAFKEMRAKTLYGSSAGQRADLIKAELSGEDYDGADISADNTAECFGLYFRWDGINYTVVPYRVAFDNRQTWNPLKGWVYSGCGAFHERVELPVLEMDSLFKILEVDLSGGGFAVLGSDFVVQFEPPSAKAEVSTNTLDFESIEEFKLLLQFGDDPVYQRELIFNLNEGHVSKKKP
ncbi:prepilin-type N-terminal cleavage/methylation domain-containing protein [Candidatus Peregrinibacteria bacterium]|nr:prepilin-type N-terminal cleavage/methylation domain-containing protein [Candidatus Peregrinibacteria bacterium]